MIKAEADKLIEEMNDMFAKARRTIDTSRELDEAGVKAELTDLMDRLSALERQRQNFAKYVKDMSKALVDTMNETMNVIVEFENNRKLELTSRLEEITGHKWSETSASVIHLPTKENEA